MHHSAILAALVAAVACPPVASGAASLAAKASSAQPGPTAEQGVVLARLADDLEHFYVFPEVGKAYAGMLRAKLAHGTYAGLASPAAFAARVTADLSAVHPDAHLRLMAAGSAAAPAPAAHAAAAARAEMPASTRPSGPPGLEAAEMIGATAVLRFNMFPEDDGATAARARDFLLAHAGEIRAVVIDERPHRGGGFQTMDAILPLFFAHRTTLLRLDTRAGSDVANDCADSPYLVRAASDGSVIRCDHVIAPDAAESRLQKVPLFVLTSRLTASAAEHLALGLKRTHRATLIGERTRGAGHYGTRRAYGASFAAFIPVGRTYDPDTGLDWEGRGVAPDIAAPADDALGVALRLAAGSKAF